MELGASVYAHLGSTPDVWVEGMMRRRGEWKKKEKQSTYADVKGKTIHDNGVRSPPSVTEWPTVLLF